VLKLVVVLRWTTEWVELVEAGMAVLYDIEDKGIDNSKIVEWRPERYVEGLLGDENASQRIAKIINSVLQV
jgi:UDP-N-acetylglucosamine 2-epimerase